MSSTSKSERSEAKEYFVKDLSRDVLIYLADKGRQIVIKDSKEDLSETIIYRPPLCVMSNKELVKELERIVGEYDVGDELTVEGLRIGFGASMIMDEDIMVSVLVAGGIIEELRRKHGFVITMSADAILHYNVKTTDGTALPGSIQITFGKECVVFQNWQPFQGTVHHSIIEYADPRCNADGIAKHIPSISESTSFQSYAPTIDLNYESNLLNASIEAIKERLREVEEEGRQYE